MLTHTFSKAFQSRVSLQQTEFVYIRVLFPGLSFRIRNTQQLPRPRIHELPRYLPPTFSFVSKHLMKSLKSCRFSVPVGNDAKRAAGSSILQTFEGTLIDVSARLLMQRPHASSTFCVKVKNRFEQSYLSTSYSFCSVGRRRSLFQSSDLSIVILLESTSLTNSPSRSRGS
jgi:hypothetical protein